MKTNNALETTVMELTHAERIARRIEAVKERGTWRNGVKEYELMLLIINQAF